MVVLFLDFQGTSMLFSIGCTNLHFHQPCRSTQLFPVQFFNKLFYFGRSSDLQKGCKSIKKGSVYAFSAISILHSKNLSFLLMKSVFLLSLKPFIALRTCHVPSTYSLYLNIEDRQLQKNIFI